MKTVLEFCRAKHFTLGSTSLVHFSSTTGCLVYPGCLACERYFISPFYTPVLTGALVMHNNL